jgi:arylformamidase
MYEVLPGAGSLHVADALADSAHPLHRHALQLLQA